MMDPMPQIGDMLEITYQDGAVFRARVTDAEPLEDGRITYTLEDPQ